MTQKRKNIRSLLLFCLIFTLLIPTTVLAGGLSANKTKCKTLIYANGEYVNWEGVSNVSQFLTADGNFGFAVEKKKSITVYFTKNGKIKKHLTIRKKHPLFGGITSDDNGDLYVVTAKNNKGNKKSVNTVFVSKYSSKGSHIKTVGNTGDSSLAYYYGSDFRTKKPFSGGGCSLRVNNGCLAVNYGREMYNGHQSNSVWLLDCETLKTKKPNGYSNYNSHSFAQRVISYEEGFLFMSEGDAYNRAFSMSAIDLDSEAMYEADLFHFWMPKGNSTNMYVVNDNFAHMGDVAALPDGKVSFVATSVKALNKKAKKQNEQLFIQIFDPAQDLSKASSYTTSGNRSGYSGIDGTQKVKDYGVKWLTSYSGSYSISHPQAVANEKGTTIILYELRKNYRHMGVYAIRVSASGKVISKPKRLSKTALLNPCETPIYTDDGIWWCGNNSTDAQNYLYIYHYKL